MGRIAIVDYGVGNLHSIVNALQYLGLETLVTGDAADLERSDAIILPGVGAFPDAAEKLSVTGLDLVLRTQSAKKPILGICLGMQLLFHGSDEVRPSKGLGLISGWVDRIQTDRKLPHIGWNSLTFEHNSPLFKGLDDGVYVYFVHSFCGLVQHQEHVTARTDHGVSIVAAVGRGNVFGCQFHPEKSGDVGLQILRNFGDLNR